MPILLSVPIFFGRNALTARLATLIGALVAIGLSGCGQPPYTNIGNAELKEMLAKGVPIYDIRRADEWRQTGVIEGSRKLTFVDASGRVEPEFLPRFSAATGKNDPVIIICRTGSRSDALGRMLMKAHGYTQVYNVRDGITAWIGAGNPVVRH